MPTAQVPEAVVKYQTALHDMMKYKKEDKISVKDRCLQLGFAIVDPDCPMHYYRNRAPGSSHVAYWIGEVDSPAKNTTKVRDVILQLTGCGFLDMNAHHQSSSQQARYRVHVPDENEYSEICKSRLCHEYEGLKRLHTLTDTLKKDSIVEQLRRANQGIEAVANKCRLVPEDQWEQRCATDPYFADLADEFWLKDATFHRLPLLRTSMRFTSELLTTVLVRSRLTACQRARILQRIPQAFREHEGIIEAVAQKPCRGSLEELVKALREHIDNAEMRWPKTSGLRTGMK